jgi:hypothetical protein
MVAAFGTADEHEHCWRIEGQGADATGLFCFE